MAALSMLVLAVTSCSSSETSTDLGGDSPLAAHLGLLDLNNPESRAREIERRQAQQDEVVACMAEQGFDHIPLPFDLPEPELTGAAGTEGTEEWVEQWGFGLTTRWFLTEQIGPDLLGLPDEDEPLIDDDPNAAYVGSLEPAEQQRYLDALYGGDDGGGDDSDDDQVGEDGAPGTDSTSALPGGCQGLAAATAANPFYADFASELQELNQQIAADPAFEEFATTVRGCMTDSGYPDFVDLDTTLTDLENRLLDIDAEVDALPPIELTMDDLADLTDEERAELLDGPPPAELDDSLRARLSALQDEELALAAALGECDGGVLAEEQLRREVRDRYEEAFIETYQDRLEPYRNG
jgi:hypothetical protein